MERAYLDIETAFDGGISVIGIHRPPGRFAQLVGGQVTDVNLQSALSGVTVIVTFNGASFDFPVIRRVLGIDLDKLAAHRDLLQDCRRRGIRGGLKRVEVLFGIPRTAQILEGTLAPLLWQRFEQEGDRDALDRLLAYNREDVVNLEVLEAALDGMEGPK